MAKKTGFKIHTKWWFWVILAIVLLIIIGFVLKGTPTGNIVAEENEDQQVETEVMLSLEYVKVNSLDVPL